MRGLKRLGGVWYTLDKVASFTDAWIETKSKKAEEPENEVASFTDAWIETNRP